MFYLNRNLTEALHRIKHENNWGNVLILGKLLIIDIDQV